MGWLCVTDECSIVNGAWDGQGIAYFSIADEIAILHRVFFDFLLSMTFEVAIFWFMLFAVSFVVALIVSVLNMVKKHGA